jgi:hypothetical protein
MLKFAGDRAVGLGASDKELAALPVLTNEQIRALTIRASAIHRSSRDEVNAAAKRITAGRNAAALGIPNPLDLATFVPPDTVLTCSRFPGRLVLGVHAAVLVVV